MRRVFVTTSVILALLLAAMPAAAEIHEIVAAECNGKGALEPPGVVDPSKPSYVRPLLATGVATFVPGPGMLTIFFDLAHRASKYASDGPIVVITDGAGPGVDLILNPLPVELDHPSSDHCRKLRGLPSNPSSLNKAETK